LKTHQQHGDSIGPCPVVQGQCPATCPECQQCIDGQTCSLASGGTCENNVCKECLKGNCVNKTPGTACPDGGKCNNGTCTPRPSCSSPGIGCIEATAQLCCSRTCSAAAGGQCEPSAVSEACKTDADCDVTLICSANFTCQVPR